MNRREYFDFLAGQRLYEMKKEKDFKEKLKVRQDKNNDTTIRIEIHSIINQKLKEGKNKKEIIKSLSDERFTKYKDYFESWINDDLKKLDNPRKFEGR